MKLKRLMVYILSLVMCLTVLGVVPMQGIGEGVISSKAKDVDDKRACWVSYQDIYNELRDKIMPINKAYPLEVLIPAIKKYLDKTNRRVTFEYIMLKDINDSEECAKELANLVRGINCYINLIPYNETNNLGFLRSNTIQIERFYDILKKNNIGVTIRREFGTKISAACGQLRSKKEEL